MYVIIPLVDVGFSSRFFLLLETIPSVGVGFSSRFVFLLEALP
jgi:hypothetical protein